ncbi:nonsense-mediated mRNA decay factor SMG7 [Amyelois transitella]|uniref:nonsense-mediated mRNA decay factor SMG7 n=1 Tax=Amyelois transitella TaxID=680683 RepID=UPI0029903352|nr:nonsense-mediated mRNA decay factor SMG7 [Amyelois transitella]
MVLNAAVQMLREADELKEKILKFKSGTSMLQERSLWASQQQLQKVYQKVLVLDLDYALDKKVEQDLWNIGFKQQIEALQAIIKDRKNPLRSEGQAMLTWVLQAAAGFYLCLLHQICTTFKLDLPFRRRASLLGLVEGWGAEPGAAPPPAAAQYICQHCLVHLGDLARYRQQLRQAHTFYRHALMVSAHSGQPYNQLALVWWRLGARLRALYWHVRSVLVRAPFPPARANLARTLRAAAAAAAGQTKDLPVLPGLTSREAQSAATPQRLDAESYVAEMIRAVHLIHTVEDLDTATAIVNNLNSFLTPLVGTQSFEPDTLIQMACVLIWLVHSCTEDLKLDTAELSADEARGAALAQSLCANSVLALALSAYSTPSKKTYLAALKVWASWLTAAPAALRWRAWRAPALWPALARAASAARAHALRADTYDTVPLPEDEELNGFLPLEASFEGLRFANYACWDTYGGKLPDLDSQIEDKPPEVSSLSLSSEPELEHRLRARRLVALAKELARLQPDCLSYTEENGELTFTAATVGGEQLSESLAELSVGEPGARDSDEEPPPPIVISEADFREKVREKRVGILKPQGSLERAREERALASTQDDQEPEAGEECNKSEDKKEKKPRVNIAMAAIMRKQEESNKQVKFVTPPPTPDSAETETKDEKPKIIQPKPIKSLANLPIGRKTGGILSLKDKSAGYPHLVNTDPEPKKEKEEKREQKTTNPTNPQQNYQHPPQQGNWAPNMATQTYNEPRMNFQKNYGIQNAGISYNPNYQPPGVGSNIRLPVVNPKEIDVRTAALQKQSSRHDMFHDVQKFGHNYQMSGDKKNFLNDLPPRFANQYKYWQNAQENENIFRDDSFKNQSLFNTQQPNWLNNQRECQPTWWKPDQSFNNAYTTPSMNLQSNFYTPPPTNIGYQMPSFNQNQGLAQNKDMIGPNYMQSTIGQPQLQTLQNMVTSPSFSSSLNNFNYPAVGYDASMYPQFNKMSYQPLPVPKTGYPANEPDSRFGNMDMQRNINFNDTANEPLKSMDQIGARRDMTASSTYSLFSGAPDTGAWGNAHAHPQQSLWSGPGPSPLERLLEQQKQVKPPPPQ